MFQHHGKQILTRKTLRHLAGLPIVAGGALPGGPTGQWRDVGLSRNLAWEADGAIGLSMAVMSVLLWWRHAENIRRLLAGKETRIGSKKS
jgi:hypothetical protein